MAVKYIGSVKNLSCDVDMVEPYKEKFHKVIEEMVLTLEDKNDLFWWLLQQKIMFTTQDSAPG